MTGLGLTQEDLALLERCELTAEDGSESDVQEERDSVVAGFRERLALGDLSW